jgi:ABC-type nickel/cobalt efflux system permease component RcnA
MYFCLILYFIVKIFLQFKSKQSQLPHMSRIRRLFYEGIIYRFKFLLLSTLVCVAMTISFAIVNNFNENQWKFDEERPVLNHTSAFLTGVYAMWNIYVSALMIFYAPSHKNKPSGQQITADDQNGEQVEFAHLTSTYSAESNKTESLITAFATKISAS